MNIKINGNAESIESNLSVTKLLEIKNVEMPDMVSVELNNIILQREEFSSTIVKENDAIEFLYFMGGGAFSQTGRKLS